LAFFAMLGSSNARRFRLFASKLPQHAAHAQASKLRCSMEKAMRDKFLTTAGWMLALHFVLMFSTALLPTEQHHPVMLVAMALATVGALMALPAVVAMFRGCHRAVNTP
jgi:hypothetical protein